MNPSKKLRIDSNSQKFCKICQIVDQNKSETITLTDPRLMTLNPCSDDSTSGDILSDIPQFRITEFTIHDSERRFCWFDSNPIEEGNQLFLCGYVRPIVSDSDSDINGFNEQMMTQMIGPLQEWWFAGFDGGTKLLIGVESEFASYVLCQPNKHYFNLFTECTKNMFLTKLIIELLLKNPDLSYEQLIKNLEERGQDFTQQSIMKFCTFIIQQIKSFDSTAEEDEILVSETPAFKTLVDFSGISSQSKNLLQSKSTFISHVRPIARTDARRLANSDTLTCSTPLVTKFFDSVFKDVIECETNNSEDINRFERNNSLKNVSQMVSNDCIKKINWIGNSVYEDRFARTVYYSSVRINDLTYTSGDFIVFKENNSSLKLGRIMFMFSTSDKTKFSHIHYFCHGKDTILGETAPKSMVFMTSDCNHIFVEQIDNKIDVILSNEFESNGTQSERYFCRKLYNQKYGRFEDLPTQTLDEDIKCINCFIQETNQKQKIPQLIDEITNECNHFQDSNLKKYKKLIYKNENYSVGESALFSSDAFPINYFNYENNKQMVEIDKHYDQTLYPERYRKESINYIKGLNNDLPKTLNIGSIAQIFRETSDSTEETKLLVNIFYRPQNIYQDYHHFRGSDLNVVFWSDHQIVISIDCLRGKCQVIYSNKSLETNIYLETKLFYFNQCFDIKEKSFSEPNQDIINRFISNNNNQNVCRTQLNVLDVFGGCGGLSYGFDKLGLVSKLWCIEKDFSAINSFKANFKSAQVFQEDVNHFLDEVIKGSKCDRNGIEYPKKGQVDLILGGPPCQGFSGMNRFSSRHYSLFKNSLVVSFLSFVDFYRPKYLILENVRNFSLFKSSMILKMTLSCLISMGYQCHFAILQAGSYGLPQTRRRTVIMGASSGNKLPYFPEPSHVFSRRQCQLSVTIDNNKYCGLTTKSCAQFPVISVWDAISDLPELGEDYAIDKVREYPLNGDITHFQRIMRTNCERQLFEHFCKELSELCRLRIENIPQTLSSDWRDLPNISLILSDGTLVPKLKYNYKDSKNGRSPQSNQMRGVCACAQQLTCNTNECRQENTLIPWCLVHTANRQYNWSGLYGRLSQNGYFPTTVTNPEPISKQGRVLHPNQNRIISIRESARSQGFPDSFVLIGSVSDKYRQIGNAVPIPLSFALSRQFLTIL